MSKLIKLLVKLSIILAVLYSATWFGATYFLTQELASINKRSDITFAPVPSKIAGFPFWPRIEYSGIIKTSKYSINVKNMDITMNGDFKQAKMAISLPEGFTLTDIYTNTPQSFKSSHLHISAPYPLPKSNKVSSMKQWRDNKGKILVTSLLVQKKDIKISGAGVVILDSSLQPNGKIDLEVDGYQSLLNDLGDLGIIPKKEAGIVGALLSGLFGKKKANEPSNVPAFKTPLIIKQGGVYIGPMKVGRVNKIKWSE